MKRILSLVMALALCLGLCACGSGGTTESTTVQTAAPPEETGYLVGYGKVDITPKYEVTLQGNGDDNVRIATGYNSYIYAICVAITDPEGNTALLISVDSCAYSTELSDQIRDQIVRETKIPRENIAVSAIHQHSTPSIRGQYVHDAREGTVESAIKALEDRSPATMEIATVVTENMNFVRHYLMNDGTYCGAHFGSESSGYKDHAYDSDPEMQLVKFRRTGDKQDILLTNFQCHPHMGGYNENYYSIHADWVGIYRDEIEATLGVLPIYFSGAGGDMNSNSRIKEENPTKDYKEHGRKMAEYALSAEGSYEPVELGPVMCKEITYRAKVNHAEDHLVDVASEIHALWEETRDYSASMAEYRGMGINSVYHAGAILSKSKLGETAEIPSVSVITFGDVALVSAPYEMFSPNGIYIKETSPFALTVIATQSNAAIGYLPAKFTFTYGSYETNTSRYAEGTAEELADLYISMLNELHQ